MSDLNSDLNADFTIDLKTAQTYAAKWRDPNTSLDYRALHAFLIPTQNLKDILAQEPTAAVRAYLGINDDGEAKLLMVGTIWDKDHNSHNDMLPDSDIPGKIYNFTRPCPPFCAFESPLNDLPKTI
jgi:hypothetical protein